MARQIVLVHDSMRLPERCFSRAEAARPCQVLHSQSQLIFIGTTTVSLIPSSR